MMRTTATRAILSKLILVLVAGGLPLGTSAENANLEAIKGLPLYPVVTIETNVGIIKVELDAKRAPMTVGNFARYVNSGFYEGTIFHRVINGFVAQGGGHLPDFREKEAHEPVYNESGNGLRNVRGTIAMARASDPHSALSQFYFNLADNPSLNPNPARWGYTVFGQVIEGQDILDKIALVATGPGGPFQKDVPAAPIIINKVSFNTVEEPAAPAE